MATKSGAKKSSKSDYAADMKAAQKKGDKKSFYTAQRKRAEKTGDTKTLSKIASKQMSPGKRDAVESTKRMGSAASGVGAYLSRKPQGGSPNTPAQNASNKGPGLGSAISKGWNNLMSGARKGDEQTAARAAAAKPKKKQTASNGQSKKKQSS